MKFNDYFDSRLEKRLFLIGVVINLVILFSIAWGLISFGWTPWFSYPVLAFGIISNILNLLKKRRRYLSRIGAGVNNGLEPAAAPAVADSPSSGSKVKLTELMQ